MGATLGPIMEELGLARDVVATAVNSLAPIRAELTKFAHDLSVRRPLIPLAV